MHHKKAQGLPLNTIILAVLALAVLVIMLYIFYNNSSSATKTIGSCTTKGGTCAPSTGCPQGTISLYVSADCKEQKGLCCIKEPSSGAQTP